MLLPGATSDQPMTTGKLLIRSRPVVCSVRESTLRAGRKMRTVCNEIDISRRLRFLPVSSDRGNERRTGSGTRNRELCSNKAHRELCTDEGTASHAETTPGW